MAGLAHFLQSELINLSNEAKKRHPEIKDSSERLIAILRSGKDKSITELCSDLAKSEETLRPFLLACETKQPKLITMAIGCLQKLISQHAIPEDVKSVETVVRTLSDILNQGTEIQLKVLQTILPLLSNYDTVHGELLAEALLLCFRLQESKVAVVNNTASAILRQLVIYMFDKVTKEDQMYHKDQPDDLGKMMAAASNATDTLRPCAKDAYLIFQDLCLLSSGDPPQFIRVSNLPRTFGLELMESILTNHHQVFLKHPQFSYLVQQRVCPVVIKTFSEKTDFAQTLRLMRVVLILIKYFSEAMGTECEIFLSMLLKILEPDNPLWQRVLAMEVFKAICSDAVFLRVIFRIYDQQKHSSNLFQDLINSLNKLGAEKPLIHVGSGASSGSESAGNIAGGSSGDMAILTSSSILRIPCIDQLDKMDPPQIPDLYLTYLSLNCTASIIEGFTQTVIPQDQGSVSKEEPGKIELTPAILTTKDMANVAWPGLLASLSLFLTSSVDDEFLLVIVRSFQNFTNVAGLLDLVTPRDAFLTSLCKNSLPGYTDRSLHDSVASTTTAGANLPSMSDKNLICISAIISVAHCLSSVLGSAWIAILETLQQAEYILNNKMTRAGSTLLQKKLAMSNQFSSAISPVKADRKTASPQGTPVSTSFAESELMILLKNVKKLFESSKTFSDSAFVNFVKALCHLSGEKSGNEGPVSADSPSGSGFNSEQSNILHLKGIVPKFTSKTDDQQYAIDKLRQISSHNLSRIATQLPEAWDLIINNLVNVANNSSSALSVRMLACESVCEIVSNAMQQLDRNSVQTDPVLQKKLLHPLNRITSSISASTTTVSVEVPKQALDTLAKILQMSGHSFTHTWSTIFDILKSVCILPSSNHKPALITDDDSVGIESQSSSSPRTPLQSPTQSKALGLVKVAFPCLQLICTDYLSALDTKTLYQCASTVVSFALQTEDLNISLTSVGLLWTISDHVQTNKDDLIKLSASVDNTDSTGRPIAQSSAIIDLWMELLLQLLTVCSDSRPEVRNGAIQTLFRTITNNANAMTIDLWNSCIWKILFPLFDTIKVGSSQAIANPSNQKPKEKLVMVHHSRNTVGKQWDETKVLTLLGETKIFKDVLPTLITMDNFEKAWGTLLGYIEEFGLYSSPEVSLASMKGFKMLLSLSSEYPSLPANTQQKYLNLWTTAWAVWEHIGLSMAKIRPQSPTLPPTPISSVTLQTEISHETLTLYVTSFNDLYLILKPNFDTRLIKRLLDALKTVLDYAGRGKEYPNDADQLVPLQNAVLECLIKLDTDVPLAPSLILHGLMDLVLLAFRSNVSGNSNDSATGKKFVNYPSYIALSKRAMNLGTSMFHRFVENMEIYKDGVFEKVIKTLSEPMKLKYNCPASGKQDASAIWKAATTSFLDIVAAGLKMVEKNMSVLPPERTNSIFEAIVEGIEGYVMSKSSPSTALSLEDLNANEQFDISFIKSIQSDIIIQLGQPHVPDAILEKLILSFDYGSRMIEPSSLNETTNLVLNSTSASQSTRETAQGEASNAATGINLGTSQKEQPLNLPVSTVSNGVPVTKEKFAMTCLDALFGFCSNEYSDYPETRRHVAKVAVTILLEKCKTVITAYTTDKQLNGKLPFSRLRDEELKRILFKLSTIKLLPGIIKSFESSSNQIHQIISKTPYAHLFYLYPSICDCLVASASSPSSSSSILPSMSGPPTQYEPSMSPLTSGLNKEKREQGKDDEIGSNIDKSVVELLVDCLNKCGTVWTS
ncbi:hypothetical protein BKA69DRAFT_1116837 [Paraphysoderma sedebokerense]|nr:hypothetical protein BKA69DRAFT_1116837 [Paraphysoderma sedebokerense]